MSQRNNQEGSVSPTELRRERARRGRFHVQGPRLGSAGPPLWDVEGSTGKTYQVILPSFPSREGAQCSCPDFLTRSLGTCKHVEAVLANAAVNIPAFPERPRQSSHLSWAEIEGPYGEAVRVALEKNLSHQELARTLRRASRPLVELDDH